MKLALYWKKLRGQLVQCQLCPHFCVIKEGEYGRCGARKNIKGKIYSMVYGYPVAVHIDPIEKKPLYHFLLGSQSLSIGTIGCNLSCLHCQNYEISQMRTEDIQLQSISPNTLVDEAIKANCKSIAYTYTEPTIFYEYMLDTAKLAKKRGLKNVIVSNGFINPKPLKKLTKYIDAANIDLKSFSEEFYKKVCGARLSPVLSSLRSLKEDGVWVEITNLIIPSLNDDFAKIEKMCKWILGELGASAPLHFSAFYPAYKLKDKPPTPPKTLEKARALALKIGLKYVYVGNVYSPESEATYCPNCKKAVIRRSGFRILENFVKKGLCGFCGEKIAGVF